MYHSAWLLGKIRTIIETWWIIAINENSTPLTHYVIIRRDLPIGFISAQLVHAAGESVSGSLPQGTFAVVLEVEDEPRLRELANNLQIGDIKHTLITEVDAPYTGQATAIGIEPTRNRGELKKYLSSLPLFGKHRMLKE